MVCGVNVFIDHAILYPGCINTKNSTANCMRWHQNHLYCCCENEPYTPWLFCTRFKQGEWVFLLQSPVAAFPGGRGTYDEWHDGQPSSWIINVAFGACFPFDIIGEIPDWPRKMAIMERNYYPRIYRTDK